VVVELEEDEDEDEDEELLVEADELALRVALELDRESGTKVVAVMDDDS
jgi:hypothetical protein